MTTPTRRAAGAAGFVNLGRLRRIVKNTDIFSDLRVGVTFSAVLFTSITFSCHHSFSNPTQVGGYTTCLSSTRPTRAATRTSLTVFLVASGLRILQDFAGFCRVNCLILLIRSGCTVTHNP